MSDATGLIAGEAGMKDHVALYGKLFPSASWRQAWKERADDVFGYIVEPYRSVNGETGNR